MTLGRSANLGGEAHRREAGSANRARRAAVAALLGVAVVASAQGALALQPLSAFLEKADAGNNDLRAASADAVEKEAEADVAIGRLFPALSARGIYTRNQKAITLPAKVANPDAPAGSPDLVLTPVNQLDAYFQIDVPIFDPRNFGQWRAARAIAAATKISIVATKQEVQRQVVMSYYQILGSVSLIEAAKKSADVTAKNLQLVKDRRAGGIASDLDAARASADVQRAAVDIATSELTLGLAVRTLESLTTLSPAPADKALPGDDWHDEAPLATWMANGGDTPIARAAEANLHAAQVARDSTRLAFVPAITGSAVEHLTNAPSFTGSNAFWTASLTAAWRFDYTLVAGLKQANAAVTAAQARRDGAQRSSDDAIFKAWLTVGANIAKSRAARAQADAANQAVTFASDRYLGGIATQLDVVTAQRDAFQADAARISADADLAASRILLRLAAGRLPGAERRTP